MKMKYLITIILLVSLSFVKSQKNYCIQFSKEKKNPIIIEERKKISFVIQYNKNWKKGVITKITPDSLFIEQERPKEEMLTEKESNYEVIGYEIKDFRMMAYTKTAPVVGGTALSLVLLATFYFTGIIPIENDDEKPAKQFFKKNIDFEDGWKAAIVLCED